MIFIGAYASSTGTHYKLSHQLHHWAITLHVHFKFVAAVDFSIGAGAVISFVVVVVVVAGGRGRDRDRGRIEWTVRLRIDSTAIKLSFDVSVPIILDLIISPSRQPCGY